MCGMLFPWQVGLTRLVMRAILPAPLSACLLTCDGPVISGWIGAAVSYEYGCETISETKFAPF